MPAKPKTAKPVAERIAKPEREAVNDQLTELKAAAERIRKAMASGFYVGEPGQEQRDEKLLAQAAITAATAELQSEVAKWKEQSFRPLGDNHHNAALCPHCGEPLRKSLAEIVELQAKVERLEVELASAIRWGEGRNEVADAMTNYMPDAARELALQARAEAAESQLTALRAARDTVNPAWSLRGWTMCHVCDVCGTTWGTDSRHKQWKLPLKPDSDACPRCELTALQSQLAAIKTALEARLPMMKVHSGDFLHNACCAIDSLKEQLAAKGEEVERKLWEWVFKNTALNDDSCKSIAAEARRIVEGK